MAVKAAAYLILFQKRQNFRTLIALVPGRIVQKNQFWLLPSRLQGGFQPDQLPSEHLLIMLPGPLLLEEPAPGSTDGVRSIIKAVVVQKMQVFKPVFPAELIKFRSGGPPVIVISLENDFSAGNISADPFKIRFRVGQIQRPAQISQ